MRVDVLDWHAISESFHRQIERDYVVVQENTNRTVADEPRETSFSQLLAEPVRNGVYKKREFHGRGVKIVNMGELFANPRLRDVDMRRVELSESERQRFSVQAGDLLFARRSLVAEGAGKCIVVLEIREPTAFESSIIRARPDPTVADSLFLYYYFNSPIGLHALDTIRRQVAVAGITGTDLAQLPVKVPSLPEQRAIAHVLGTLDDKIELNRQMNETLEEMARALFKSWFVDFDPVRAKMEGRWRRGESLPGLPADLYDLFPDRLVPSELGEIPEGWEVKTLGDVIEVLDSRRVPLNSRQRAKRQGPYPYYGAAGVMDHVDDFLFDGVYVLAGEDGTVIDAEGYPVVQYIWGRFWVNNHAHVLQGRSGFSEEHLYLLLKQVSIFAFVTGAVQPKLSQRNLKSVPVIVPGGPTCEAFSDLIGPLFEMVRANTDEAKHLAGQRDTLLPKLVVGEVTRNAVSPSAPVYRESSLLRGV